MFKVGQYISHEDRGFGQITGVSPEQIDVEFEVFNAPTDQIRRYTLKVAEEKLVILPPFLQHNKPPQEEVLKGVSMEADVLRGTIISTRAHLWTLEDEVKIVTRKQEALKMHASGALVSNRTYANGAGGDEFMDVEEAAQPTSSNAAPNPKASPSPGASMLTAAGRTQEIQRMKEELAAAVEEKIDEQKLNFRVKSCQNFAQNHENHYNFYHFFKISSKCLF